MRQSQFYTLLNAKATTGVDSAGVNVLDSKTIAFSLSTAGTSTLTVKFVGSISQNCPDFTAAQSASNQWDYIDVIDLEDGASIDGDIGVSTTASDDHRLFEANVNGLKWVTAIVTARSGGSVTVCCRTFND